MCNAHFGQHNQCDYLLAFACITSEKQKHSLVHIHNHIEYHFRSNEPKWKNELKSNEPETTKKREHRNSITLRTFFIDFFDVLSNGFNDIEHRNNCNNSTKIDLKKLFFLFPKRRKEGEKESEK